MDIGTSLKGIMILILLGFCLLGSLNHLAGFLPAFCIGPGDIKYVTFISEVRARPEVVSDDYRDFWSDSGVDIAGGEDLIFKVTERKGLGFCNERPLVADIGGGTNDLNTVINVHKGDHLVFDVVPFEYFAQRSHGEYGHHMREKGVQHVNSVDDLVREYEKRHKGVDVGEWVSAGSVVGNFDGSTQANVWRRGTSANHWIHGAISDYSTDPGAISAGENCNTSDNRIHQNNAYIINKRCGRICTGNESGGGIDNCYYSRSFVDEENAHRGEFLEGLRAKVIGRDGKFLELPRIGGGAINPNHYDIEDYPDWPDTKFRNIYAEGIRMGYSYTVGLEGRLSIYFHNYLPGLYKIINNTRYDVDHRIRSVLKENGSLGRVWTNCGTTFRDIVAGKTEKDMYKSYMNGRALSSNDRAALAWTCTADGGNNKVYDQYADIYVHGLMDSNDQEEFQRRLEGVSDRAGEHICRATYFFHTKKKGAFRYIKSWQNPNSIPNIIEINEITVTDGAGNPVVDANGNEVTRLECSSRRDHGDGSTASGGYRIAIQHICNVTEERGGLFYYVGDEAPPILPGAPGSTDTGVTSDSRLPHAFYVKAGRRGGRIFFGVKGKSLESYKQHRGTYVVKTVLPREGQDVVSFIIRWVRDQVFRVFYGKHYDYDDETEYEGKTDMSRGVVIKTFEGITSGNYFAAIVKAALTLFIILQMILFAMGMIQKPGHELIISGMKISFVVLLLQPNSWAWFKELFFAPFIYGTGELINVVTIMGESTSASSASGSTRISIGDFHFLDQLLYRFIIPETWLQMTSFMYASYPMGWLMILAIMWSVYTFFGAVFNAICIYFTSIVAIAILMIMAPLFIVFILFKRTKAFFDAWMKSVVQAAMQPVFIFAALGLFLHIMTGIVMDVFSFDACISCVWTLKWWIIEICPLKFFLPLGQSILMNTDKIQDDTVSGVGFLGFPIQVTAFFMLLVVAYSMDKFVHFTSQMALTIFGAPGADMEPTGKQIAQSLEGLVGQDKQSRAQRQDQKHDSMESRNRATPTAGDSPDKGGKNAPPDLGNIDTGDAKLNEQLKGADADIKSGEATNINVGQDGKVDVSGKNADNVNVKTADDMKDMSPEAQAQINDAIGAANKAASDAGNIDQDGDNVTRLGAGDRFESGIGEDGKSFKRVHRAGGNKGGDDD